MSVLRSALTILAAATLAGLVMRLNNSPWDEVTGLVALLSLIAGAWLAGIHLLARRPRSGSLRRHYAAGSIAAAALVLVSAICGTELMVVSQHDARAIVALLAFSLIVALRIASVLAAHAASQITRLADGLGRLACERGAEPMPETGPHELAALAAAANRMAHDLHASDRARRDLVAAISHDLRTPLASLSLLVDAIADGVVTGPEEVADYRGRMHVHLKHLRELVDDLFELARLDAGDAGWERSPTVVAEIVEESTEAFRPSAAERGVRVVERIQADLPRIEANPPRLQRVLFNLLENAVDHAPPGGEVVVAATRDNGAVRFEVADPGAGIGVEEAGRVFERFYRGGDASARPVGGAGLGLAIARSIVEAHGGRIWVVNPGEPGARLAFTVPVSSPP